MIRMRQFKIVSLILIDDLSDLFKSQAYESNGAKLVPGRCDGPKKWNSYRRRCVGCQAFSGGMQAGGMRRVAIARRSPPLQTMKVWSRMLVARLNSGMILLTVLT
jgi:hypothetical protein